MIGKPRRSHFEVGQFLAAAVLAYIRNSLGNHPPVFEAGMVSDQPPALANSAEKLPVTSDHLALLLDEMAKARAPKTSRSG